MTGADDSLSDDVATLKAMLLADRAARTAAEVASQALALMIEKLKFAIAKLRHERFGQSSERAALIEQLELQLADLEEKRPKPRWRWRSQVPRRAPIRSRSEGLNGASRLDARFPTICRASGLSIRRPQPVCAAAAPCVRSART
jgi:hypothetical protein